MTLVWSASLLFVLQPLYGRMLLPLLGGSPAVWNTALVFYQGALLLGYLYAHLLAPPLPIRILTALHLVLFALAALALPVALPAIGDPSPERPIGWVLAALLLGVGAPFVVMSATAPLLQAWFARTAHPDARDPYFLYAASNVGSLAGLLGYPLLVEPNLRLGTQALAWTGGYAVLGLLLAACASVVWRAPRSTEGARAVDDSAPTVSDRAWWVLLSAVPSSLLLGVTSHVTTDIAPVPLLWVVPLALYLATFVLVFSRSARVPIPLLVKTQGALLVLLVLYFAATSPAWLVPPLHLAVFFTTTLLCHAELARRRPPAQHLTAFYLWMSFGGVLGGAVTALLAPMAFDRIAEYPLALAAACFLRPRLAESGAGERRRTLLDVVLPLVLVGGVFAARARGFDPTHADLIGYFLFFVPVGLLTYSFSERPLRFGLAVAGILASWMAYPVLEGRVLERGRSFFGSYIVTESKGFHVFAHGTTIHGAQATAPAGRRTPSAYYSSEGPVGQVFGAIGSRLGRVGVIGLGAGAAACYARPGQDWTFYEIDPLVERIARDPRLFTYLTDCAPSARVVLGDARLSLMAERDARFDLLVVDAFSSDAIPVHLITREAMALYARKLAPGGVLLLHLSNRNLDLVPVVGNLLFEAGFSALHQAFRAKSSMEAQMALSAEWVASAPEESALGPLARDPRWERLQVYPSTPVWTDDFSNVLGALRWR